MVHTEASELHLLAIHDIVYITLSHIPVKVYQLTFTLEVTH